MRFVLSEDQPSLTEKNSKKLLLQQVGNKNFKINRHMFFSNRFPHHGIHRLFRQADPYSD